MNYGTYVFDFDNTLFDTRRGYESCYVKTFEAFGIHYDPARYFEYIRTPMHQIFENHYPGCPCKYREFVALFLKEADRTVVESAVPFPETDDCLQRLSDSGKTMGIVSGSSEYVIRDVLERNGFDMHFDTVVGYESAVRPKPDPYTLNLCLERLDSDPSDSVYVGDSPGDMIAAERAGMGKILIKRDDHAHGCGADRVISSLLELF